MHATMLIGEAYEVGPVLGRGGMAEVRDGWDLRSQRGVAVKMLYPQFAARPDLRLRFEAEAATMAALQHPNIVAVYDSGEHEGIPYIVMERLPGDALDALIARGPLDQQVVRSVLDGVLGALAASHALGVLHRDIKPGNLLRAADGPHYKLGDFGIAKTGAPSHTAFGAVFGTFAYLSPQRLSGIPSSVGDDLYAVGVIGYEALAGRHPFGSDQNLGALVQAIMGGQRPPLATVRPDIDPYLTTVIEQAMSADPAARYGSAEEMRAALHPPAPWMTPRPTLILDHPPHSYTGPVPVPAPLPAPAPPRRNRARGLVAAAGLVAVLAVAALAVVLGASDRTPVAPVNGSTLTPTPSAPTVAPSMAPTPAVEPPVFEDTPPPPEKKHDKPGKGPKKPEN